jgi:MarR family transcriptional regulator, organic hydroperoxide resistance regulator
MVQNEKLKLDNQLCFAIYACTRQMTKLYKPYLDELGLTYTQYISLLVLWEEDKITVKELGKKLYLDSGTLTPLLKKLETMEFIERTRDKNDERNVVISLTPSGKTLKEKAYEIPSKVFSHTGLSLEDAISIREDLKKMLSTMD